MDFSRKWMVRIVVFGISFSATYAAVALLTFIVCALLLNRDVILPNGILNDFQITYYYGGGGIRMVWQAEPKCVDPDDDLIYKPKFGECQFSNQEFRTTLHFDELGRVSSHAGTNPGVAVIGDSVAMGWGVADE